MSVIGVILFLVSSGQLSIASRGFPQGHLIFRSYSSAQGLGNLVISRILQDPDGFLWMGTEDGLYRYDGDRFTGYGWRDGLPSLTITSLHLTPNGQMWVGTSEGMARWNGRDFQQISAGTDLPRPFVDWISSGPDGRLWAITPRGPIRQQVGGHFELISDWPGGEATSLWARPGEKSVWIAGLQNGATGVKACVYEWERDQWRSWTGPAGFEKERIDSFGRDSRGRLWAHTASHLWVLKPGEKQFQQGNLNLPPCLIRSYICPGRNGDLWFPTKEGLYHLEGDRWTSLTTKDGLPSSWVRVAFVDREGSLWIGSDGLHRVLGKGEWRAYTQKEGLPSEGIWAIVRDRSGQLWIGCNSGLVRSGQTGFEPVPGTERYSIRSVVEAADGAKYMAGSPPEILRMDPATERVESLNVESNIIGRRIFRLLIDRTGTLWVATEFSGLLRGEEKAGKWIFRREEIPLGISRESFRDLLQDAAGRLWAAGDRGLALLENHRWQRFTTFAGLRRDSLSYVTTTHDGGLLVAYSDPIGLFRARYQDGRLSISEHIDESNGLTSERVYAMGDDDRGRLWIGTGRGIDMIGPDGAEHFGSGDGLVGEDISALAFLADASGDVWFGTSSGLIRFNAGSHQKPLPPPAVIMSVDLSGTIVDVKSRSMIKTPWNRNNFVARFAGLSFLKEDAVEYEVRLDGLEREWHRSTSREARYVALAPGSYTLDVKARIQNGDWGSPAGFAFRISSAWWQTWWFRILSIVAFLAICHSISRSVVKLRRRNRELEGILSVKKAGLLMHGVVMADTNDILKEARYIDLLTGLNNLQYLAARMPEEMAQVLRAHQAIATGGLERAALNISLIFVMIGMDGMSELVAKHGKAARDEIQRQMASIFKSASRNSDLLVRREGEFLVLGRNSNRLDAPVMVERIRRQVASHLFDLERGIHIRMTCSFGFTCIPFFSEKPDHIGWEQVLALAERCLWAAQRAGMNGWIGVAPSEIAGPPDIDQGNVEKPEELIQKGILKILTSYPHSEAFEWPSSPEDRPAQNFFMHS